MPELPEVETVVRTLEKQISKAKIENVEVFWDNIIATPGVQDFKDKISGQSFEGFGRYGKYLIFTMSESVLIVHLRMEGKFYIRNKDDRYDSKHIHVIFHLEDGRQLQYHDTRKFGKMYLYNKEANIHDYPCMKSIGYDAFDEELTSSYLYSKYHRSQKTMKQLLLDQAIMAGPGNIYVDEICFSSGIHPLTRGNKVSKAKCEVILQETRRILNGAIKYGGTTIRSYTSSLGVDGRFQLHLKVHKREGETCKVCGTEIKRIVVNTRSTYYCPTCQKKR